MDLSRTSEASCGMEFRWYNPQIWYALPSVWWDGTGDWVKLRGIILALSGRLSASLGLAAISYGLFVTKRCGVSRTCDVELILMGLWSFYMHRARNFPSSKTDATFCLRNSRYFRTNFWRTQDIQERSICCCYRRGWLRRSLRLLRWLFVHKWSSRKTDAQSRMLCILICMSYNTFLIMSQSVILGGILNRCTIQFCIVSPTSMTEKKWIV